MKSVFLKIACLLAALLIWILVAGTTMVEADVSLPLKIAGLPDSLTVAGSTLPDLGLVRLRASRLRLFTHAYFGRSLGAVQIDLTGLQPGPPLFLELKEADVRTEAEVVTILPPLRLRLQLDWEEKRRLPIRVPLIGDLPQDRMLDGPVVVRPDSVDVTGPRRFFADLEALVSEPVDLSGLQRTVTRELALVQPARPLRALTGKTQVTVPVALLGTVVVPDVPVIPLVENDGYEVGVLPPVCDVLVRGPVDSLAVLVPSRLTVTVLVAGLPAGEHRVPGQVRYPPWVVAIQLDPATFVVFVEPDVQGGGGR